MASTTPIDKWYVGMTDPPLDIELLNDGGVENISALVDATHLSLTIRTTNGVDSAGQGTFTIVNTYPAEVTYKVHANDVTTAGVFNAFVKANLPTGLRIYDPIQWTILPA